MLLILFFGDQMAEQPGPAQNSATARQVKTDLDAMVVTIELTLISIIQGLALQMLAGAAVQPIITLQVEYWPYLVTGLVIILLFWSRSLIHTFSVIDWPLEFGHNFMYFAATLVEGVTLTQVTNVPNWFALNTCFAAAIWLLYGLDLRMLDRHVQNRLEPAGQRLLEAMRRGQLLNVRLIMPFFTASAFVSWWLVSTWPEQFIGGHWHIVLGLLQMVGTSIYLVDGVLLLRRNQNLLIQYYVEKRSKTTPLK